MTAKGGRGARVRTGGLLLPKQARYQAAPRPDVRCQGEAGRRQYIADANGPRFRRGLPERSIIPQTV